MKTFIIACMSGVTGAAAYAGIAPAPVVVDSGGGDGGLVFALVVAAILGVAVLTQQSGDDDQ
ncbi:hypothetical protein PARPLA_01876 [Rhodobacteraceae bacterium THAF1]|uniref:hypothetical protein n=1 Tax=Palleronia sp. THAF1 TaxID=2587842 RepID=UPI000F40B4B1|nr:hypothetical protein [Palleronia sp. THAF1]QFU08989.1 hypothetical protein FIU81_09920 [Palleronia sp. THAF1]VDC24272.1 hypothetical protein PARPLA_01876 [Rhodobacteraceae bacterium THAF1]